VLELAIMPHPLGIQASTSHLLVSKYEFFSTVKSRRRLKTATCYMVSSRCSRAGPSP